MSVEPFMYGPPKPSPTPPRSRANPAPNANPARWATPSTSDRQMAVSATAVSTANKPGAGWTVLAQK